MGAGLEVLRVRVGRRRLRPRGAFFRLQRYCVCVVVGAFFQAGERGEAGGCYQPFLQVASPSSFPHSPTVQFHCRCTFVSLDPVPSLGSANLSIGFGVVSTGRVQRSCVEQKDESPTADFSDFKGAAVYVVDVPNAQFDGTPMYVHWTGDCPGRLCFQKQGATRKFEFTYNLFFL